MDPIGYKYINDQFDVDLYPCLLNEELATQWFDYLESFLSHSGRRTSLLMGDEGIIYTTQYSGNVRNKNVIPWDQIPSLIQLRDLITSITGQKCTVCAIQRYPNGKIGIAPHKDKEMIPGTKICGLSLGSTRTISFSKGGTIIDIPLVSGSLYVMNDPTNQKWTHSIIKDYSIKDPRISLTFRDYR